MTSKSEFLYKCVILFIQCHIHIIAQDTYMQTDIGTKTIDTFKHAFQVQTFLLKHTPSHTYTETVLHPDPPPPPSSVRVKLTILFTNG